MFVLNHYIPSRALTSSLAVVQRLTNSFASLSSSPETAKSLNPYHPNLQSLWAHFISILCDICFIFLHDPQELQYIAAARWPGFVQPFLDEYRRYFCEQSDEDNQPSELDLALQLAPPSEEIRLRLSRLFNISLTAALEVLYPRLTNATDWAAANKPEPDMLSKHPSQVQPPSSPKKSRRTTVHKGDDTNGGGAGNLPRISKFILVAAFLASTNPAKSDLRMFGRGLDEKKRKRRRNVPNSGKLKAGPSKVITVPIDRSRPI